MNLFSLFMTLAVPAAVAAGTSRGDTLKWVVEKNSSLDINGRTNVNRFSCDIPSYTAPDTICFLNADPNRPITLDGEIRLAIAGFDCHNKIMTADLRKTLHAERYPAMLIRFLNLDRLPVPGNDRQVMKGWVEITLAGVKRTLEIDYEICRQLDGMVVLNGSRQMDFTEFGLTPPQKLYGLVKVDKTLEVRFTLCLRKIG